MDEMKENQTPEPEDQTQETENQVYVPRPAYQVWMARVGLVLMILFVIYQLLNIAAGGF